MYIHLHGHSTYSLLEAIGNVKKMIGHISKLKMPAVGITDYNGLYGAFDLYKNAKGAGIKPLIGVEMPFVRDLSVVLGRHSLGYLCFLAKDYTGYQQLLALVSAAHVSKKGDTPYIDMDMILEHCSGDHLYVFFGGKRSFVGSMLTDGMDEKKINEHIDMLVQHFGKENVRGEIVAQDYELVLGLDRVNVFVENACKEKDIRLFVSNDFHYISPDDKEAYELALCIKDGKKIYDEDRRKVLGDYHIFSEKEIVSIMTKNGYDEDEISSLIDETEKVANTIDITIPMGETLFPNYESPSYIKEKYDQCKNALVDAS